MQERIVFFGASVTAQKTGFANILNEELNSDENKKFKNVYGYGGMHLKDAGICYIDEILANCTKNNTPPPRIRKFAL